MQARCKFGLNLAVGASVALSMLVVGVGGSAASTRAGHEPTGLVLVEASATSALPQGARSIGPMASSKLLSLEVTLRLPDPGAVASFITEVTDPGSRIFHDFLTKGEFGPRFGPSIATVDAVEQTLRADGLDPGTVASDRLSIPVVASVASVEKAFHTTIGQYRLPNGRTVYANSSPLELSAAIAPAVSGVLGATNALTEHPLFVRLPKGAHGRARPFVAPRTSPTAPKACPAAVQLANAYGAYTSTDLASFYGISPLYGLHDFGRHAYVALVEFEPFELSDLRAFEKCFGVHSPVTVTSSPSVGTGYGSGEAALDVEDFISFAPQATVDVYETPNTTAGAYGVYKEIFDDDVDNVVSTSWGICEPEMDKYFPSLVGDEHALFMQAATQGQAVFAAAGDSGSSDCYPTNGSDELAVDDPASQPDVVGVGGTIIDSATEESVWNDYYGAGAGGVSSQWCMPSYQSSTGSLGVISSYSHADTSAGCATHYYREVPDLSADASPFTGITIYYDKSWIVDGGTSLGAPLMAAMSALTDVSPYCSDYDSGDPGGLPSVLYRIADSASYHSGFYDVDKAGSNNDLTATGYKGGLYPSTAGYDMSNGIGTPIAMHMSGSEVDLMDPGLTALSCYLFARKNKTATISSVSPDFGPLGKSVTVQITGTGFLPIAGSDAIEVGSQWSSSIDCKSTTSCTAVLPPSAVTDPTSLRISAGNLVTSSAAPFTYAKPGQVTEGYWLASSNGKVFAAGDAPALGSVKASGASQIVDITATPDGKGYWLVGRNGSVTIEGDAHYAGDLPALHVSVDDIVAIAPTSDGHGYWLIGADGGEFAFGDAKYHGSLPGINVHVHDVVGMVATSDGGGYWLVGADGGVFAFGDAGYKGSLPGINVHVHDIVGMIASPTRGGYILVGQDGGTFVFGTGVQYYGSLPGRGINVHDISGLALTAGAFGYWLAGSNGDVYAFGNAETMSVPAGLTGNPIVAIAAS